MDTASSYGHVSECRFPYLRTAYRRQELTGELETARVHEPRYFGTIFQRQP